MGISANTVTDLLGAGLRKGHASRCGTCQSLCWERDLLNMLDSDFLVRLYRTMKD
jgi:hypothetical protein